MVSKDWKMAQGEQNKESLGVEARELARRKRLFFF